MSQAAAFGVDQVCLQQGAADVAATSPAVVVRQGEDGLRDLISQAAEAASTAGVPLIVLNAIVGAAGLRATMATLESGATLALANKESMVAGGVFVLEAARRSGSVILPVDSEHSAIFQCLAAGAAQSDANAVVEEILLTGSGGPFRGRLPIDLARVSPAEALAHPTWAMGPKISVDSATLMNKGLEIIEAHHLFAVPYDRITVALDPQSIVHSMVRFADGAILAHLGVPDMRTPIAYALAYPRRPQLPAVRRLDLFATRLSFERPDMTTFRCLALAIMAGEKAAAAEASSRMRGASDQQDVRGGRRSSPWTIGAPIVLNAANEIAVERFLRREILFTAIPAIVEEALAALGDQPVTSVDDVYSCDAETRRFAGEAAARIAM